MRRKGNFVVIAIVLPWMCTALALRASPLEKAISDGADAALQLEQQGDFQAARAAAQKNFEMAIAYGSSGDLDAFRTADFARRLIVQLQPLEPSTRQELLTFLRAHDELAQTLIFAVKDGNNLKGVYTLLDRLRKERPKQVAEFATLTAAICVVRDRPLVNPVQRDAKQVPDPVDVFDFYVAHESQMFFGIRRMPVDLLVYVVDTTASIDEMNWAMAKYAGTQNVGDLFFKIAYDYDYFEGKTPDRRVMMEGYNLPNILKYGGVCADQAYFATSVGKAIGVPTAYTVGVSAEMNHAWVGFLQLQGRSARWNFNSGRYESYQGVRGNVADPQGKKRIADSYVSLLAESIGTSAVARRNAVAMTDAARRLAGGKDAGGPFVTPEPPMDALHSSTAQPAARTSSSQSDLDLIEMGLRQCPTYSAGWELVADLARQGQLNESQKSRWSTLVQQLCGQKYPDFTLAVLEPMVDTVSDPAQQSRIWDAAFAEFQNRPDLAAEIRLHQAALWKNNGDLTKAGICYEDVIQRYINAGPFALRAVTGAEEVLKQMGQDAKILDLYAVAAKLVIKPDQPMALEFFRESNFFKVREAYAKKLDAAGLADQAAAIRSADVPVGSS
jgi:hypothetical protein